MNAGLADLKTTGAFRILFSIYLVTFVFSPLMAVIAFLCAAYARKRVEARVESRRLRQEQLPHESLTAQWGLDSAGSRIRNLINKTANGHDQEKLYCQKCGIEIKRHFELKGKKIGPVFTGSEMENFFDAMLVAAYKCRECGYLKCQSCVRAGDGCPNCTKLIFDAVN
jgi:ribosomal protein S26